MHSPNTTGISKREFARLDGCDEKLVRRKIQQGYLQTLSDGTLDPALVGTDWRKRTYKAKIVEDEPDDEVDPDIKRGVLDVVLATPEDDIPKEAASKAKKEYYLALLKQHQYNTEIGNAVAIEDVKIVVAEQLGLLRSALLQIPSSLTSHVTNNKDAIDVQRKIEDAINNALSNLTYDIQ